jgi:hypothetical protein
MRGIVMKTIALILLILLWASVGLAGLCIKAFLELDDDA